MTSKKHMVKSGKTSPDARIAELASTFRAPSDTTDEAILDYFSSLDCPKSLAAALMYKYNEHEQLVALETNAMDYNDPFHFRDSYAASEFLSKSSFLQLNRDRRKVAFEKFFKYEELCKETNNRFLNPGLDPLNTGANVWLLNATKRKISEVLGDFSGEELFDEANWGPGVTTLLKGEHVSATNKFHSEKGMTRDLYSLVGPLFAEAYPLLALHLHRETDGRGFDFQVGNTVVTVPKNAKTDRVIAVEPGYNLWFQKSAGTMIRRRLLRSGINLNTQGVNQQLARLGSRDNKLATVDFSSASDSIARRVVEELIPRRWYMLLNALRSVVGIHDKQVIRWEKFSSMGNGFTFELESLIFVCAAQAVSDYLQAEGEIYVHGDDVILPSVCLELFSSFTAFLGFKVNSEKTHVNSPFRESCGAHYYLGVNCKPIYLKDKLQNVESIFKLANSVRLLAHSRNSHYGCDRSFRRCWVNLYARAPKPLRFAVPVGKGDTGFISNWDEACPARAKNGIEGFLFKALINTGVTQYFEGEGLLLAALFGKTTQPVERLNRPLPVRDQPISGATLLREPPLGHGNTYDLRGRTRLRVKQLVASQWYDLGPWI